ncbi:hypothetical protein MPSEU_000857000 [Mayamaea pseudoterrestris]|nr:hypothetical protein MPSEU_000857000 [Mayamaea pseudoterrestris]
MNGDKTTELAELARSEITLGRIVGEGGFCTVSLVVSVDIDDVYDTSEKQAKIRQTFARAANQGTSRSEGGNYVMKALRHDLDTEEYSKGVVDLAIEAEFLKVLQHKNIICMRAIANCDPREAKFFVVLDRLVTTLELKFNHWRKIVEENTGVWWPIAGYCCAKAPVLHLMWKERIGAAYDIAQAIQYLHRLNIVYRDLKPENIGFDDSGELKLFDFGLAKRLDGVEKVEDGQYRLTGNTGSLRYMANEVALDQPYGLSVDSYSFGIIFWQICSLTTPFAKMGQSVHAEAVVRGNARPSPDHSWPMSWVDLMVTCWDADPSARPDFDAIVASLAERVAELDEEEGVIPTRTNEIKAKKKKKDVAPANQVLDFDTRISVDGSTRRVDADFV